MGNRYRKTDETSQDPERTICAVSYNNDREFKEDLERLMHPERRLAFAVKHLPKAQPRSWVLLTCMMPPQRQWARVIRHEKRGGTLVAVLEASETSPPNLDESTLVQPAETK